MIDVKLKQKVDERLDDLIGMARGLVKSTRIYEKVEERKPKTVEESQIRNILSMASAVDSVKALETFIQYQMGRGKIPKDFGDKLIENIYEFKEWASEFTDNVLQQKQIWLYLIRLYLGYLNMYFVYKKKIGGDEEW